MSVPTQSMRNHHLRGVAKRWVVLLTGGLVVTSSFAASLGSPAEFAAKASSVPTAPLNDDKQQSDISGSSGSDSDLNALLLLNGNGDKGSPRQHDSDFVANDASISVLLNAISARLHKPVVASEKVRRKHVTGRFDLTRPNALLTKLSDTMSLISYDDGASIYVYDSVEIKNSVVSMQNANVRELLNFIRETHLSDPRFPIRGDDLGQTFYVTGAPIYVNLVTAAARYIDTVRGGEPGDEQVVKIVPLRNTFVVDRRYKLRDQEIDIPGIATVLGKIFDTTQAGSRQITLPASAPSPSQAGSAANSDVLGRIPFTLGQPLPPPINPASSMSPNAGAVIPAAEGVHAVAVPDTNSVVLVGPRSKVADMEAIIHSLDVEKRQIELSLWIIDIRKSRLDQLGIDWQGALSAPGIGIGFNRRRNTNVTTLDGSKFLASVSALSQTGDATVVSRPVVLTQENVPATFDSNQTFYAKLIGERTAQLDHVTYGTLINVLPRLTPDASQVEMMVNIEDGNTNDPTSDAMPLVNRTEINTVARVPREMSLLVGGNTRDDVTRTNYRVPGLASIPLVGGLFRGHSEQHEQVVRVFLIQPTLLGAGASWQHGQSWVGSDVSGNSTLRATVQLLQPYLEVKQ